MPLPRRTLTAAVALVAGAACSVSPPALPRPAASVAPLHAAAPPAPILVAAPAPSTLPEVGPPTSPLCAAVLAHNAAEIGLGSPPRGPAFESPPCFPTPHGAWALRIDRWAPVDHPSYNYTSMEGTWSLVHVDVAGVEAAAQPGGERFHHLEDLLHHTITEVVGLFDYDGDGEPEILLRSVFRFHEGEILERALVATFKEGAVRELPGLPSVYEGFADADGDGRPDVLYYPFAFIAAADCSRFHYRDAGPSLLAHARPEGTFSLDDDVARAHLLSHCPAGGSLDGGPPPTRPELCLLFRGTTRAQAAAALDRECRAPRPNDDGCQPHPGVCFDHAERRAALSRRLSLRVPR